MSRVFSLVGFDGNEVETMAARGVEGDEERRKQDGGRRTRGGLNGPKVWGRVWAVGWRRRALNPANKARSPRLLRGQPDELGQEL